MEGAVAVVVVAAMEPVVVAMMVALALQLILAATWGDVSLADTIPELTLHMVSESMEQQCPNDLRRELCPRIH